MPTFNGINQFFSSKKAPIFICEMGTFSPDQPIMEIFKKCMCPKSQVSVMKMPKNQLALLKFSFWAIAQPNLAESCFPSKGAPVFICERGTI